MQVGQVTSQAPATARDGQRGVSALKSEDFFKLLVTELKNQDPFEPSKTADVISQVSQIRTIEQNAKLTDTLDALGSQQRIGGISGLIGKFVEALRFGPDGEPMLTAGVVTGVRFLSDGEVILELDTGEAVSADDLVRISTPDDAAMNVAADDQERVEQMVDQAEQQAA